MEYTIKPGTQTDTKIRLKNKGVPSLRNKNLRGNHFVTLVVQVPERMTEAQKEALRRFQEAMEKCRQRIPPLPRRQNRNMKSTKSMRSMKERLFWRKEKEIAGRPKGHPVKIIDNDYGTVGFLTGGIYCYNRKVL